MKTLRDIMRSGFLFTVQKKGMVSEAVRLMVPAGSTRPQAASV